MAGARGGGVVLTDADFLKEWGDTIPKDAFSGRADIVGVVVIPARFRKIGNGAFEYCSRLTELRLPDTLTEIGPRAFEDCSGLTELRLPGSIKSLGAYAFSACISLRLVAMHSLAHIWLWNRGRAISYQFEGCTSLTAVSAPAEVASRFPADMFEGCGTAPSALLAAATADLALWYYWSRQNHFRCSPAAKHTVLAVMLVGLRLERKSSRRRSSRRPQLPALPSEIWCCVLERVRRHDLVPAAALSAAYGVRCGKL